MGRRLLPTLLLAGLAVPAAAGTVPEAEVVLEVLPEAGEGLVPEAAPVRFALLEGGAVFVGGSDRLAAGRLEKKEAKEVEKLVSRVRKLPGLGSSVPLGPGGTRYRLSLKKGLTIAATGDPATAPASVRPLVALLEALESFEHPSLRPYRPVQYALYVKPAVPSGGCRDWTLKLSPAEMAAGPRVVAAEDVAGWPTGAGAAWTCASDRGYLVALRPLLPGERP